MSPTGRPLGRRRRRLYWTVGLLTVAVLLGAAGGWAYYRSSRPKTYRPGEAISEITSKLDLGIPAEAPDAKFVDVTQEAGLGEFLSFTGDRTSQLPEDMGAGAAWGDYDGDGDDDLFVVSQGGPLGSTPEQRAPSRLYENLGNGSFRENTEFPSTRILGMGAAWGDYDGDGDADLVVTGYDALRLFRNDDGSFVRDEAIAEREGFWSGASWSDFDLDGDLDLYVCGYVRYIEDTEGANKKTRQYGRAVPYTLNPAAFEPERNLLFRNGGDGRFEEVAEGLGVHNPEGRSLGALWNDLDRDGAPDLYVANDISDNALLRQHAKGFEDISHGAWVADYRGAMGLTSGDWNRDGDDDLFVTHWVAQENALYDSLLVDLQDSDRRDLRFMDVADQRGLGQIALQHIGWGTEFVDLDSDGWLDLVVANGSTFETDEEPRRLRPEKSFIFWNRRGESFHDVAPLVPAMAEPHVSRGMAVSDYDGDGDVDVLFVDRDAGVRLLRNDTAQGNRVQLRLRRPGNAPLEGTRVTARTPSGAITRTLNSVSYLSRSSSTLHLGFGETARIDEIEVHWPGGDAQRYDAIEMNALLELTEGQEHPRRIASWTSGAPKMLSRDQLAEFWKLQRAAMNAMKIDGDLQQAIDLFEQALVLNPSHGDSLYYLANCRAETGDVREALSQLDTLIRVNPQSQRAHKRWGTLRAVSAGEPSELDAAVAALERASAINPEETGVSLVLGEVLLLQGKTAEARQRLDWVVRSNSQSGEAYFVLGYLAWIEGDTGSATDRLAQAAGTRSEDWKPPGVVAEGEVLRKAHVESTLFEAIYNEWDGSPDPARAFGPLRARLQQS